MQIDVSDSSDPSVSAMAKKKPVKKQKQPAKARKKAAKDDGLVQYLLLAREEDLADARALIEEYEFVDLVDAVRFAIKRAFVKAEKDVAAAKQPEPAKRDRNPNGEPKATHKTMLRLRPRDLEMLDAICGPFGLPNRAEAIRYALRLEARQIAKRQ